MTKLEQLEVGIADLRDQAQLALEALHLCNESRSRLTRFAADDTFWIREAIAAREAQKDLGK